jgi:hypothetical protein
MVEGRAMNGYGVRRCLAGTVTAFICAVVLTAAPGPASDPAAPPAAQARGATPAPPPTGTATLTVQVVAGDSGTPIRGARLVISGMVTSGAQVRTQGVTQPSPETVGGVAGGIPARDNAQAPPRVAKEGRTDQAGSATFTALPAGLYSVSVQPPAAFIRGQPTLPVPLADGASAKTVVQLDRGGVITGHVFDDFGEPVTGAMVTVFRQERTGGAGRGSTYGSSQQTNDIGQFRVWGLPEGEYIVGATANDSSVGGGEPGVREGHLPTFFPGVAAFDAARGVAVKAGQETGGIDFGLVEGRLGTVSGRVTDSAGYAIGGSGGAQANVTLAPKSVTLGFGGRGAGVRPDGTFIIPGVPPGEYYLSATRSVQGPGNGMTREGAYVTISVNGDEVTANIQTNVGATISGRVVMEGTPPATRTGAPGSEGRPAPIRVSLQSASAGGYASAFTSAQPVVVRADGAFLMSGVRGPLQIAALGGGAALKSVMRGAHEIGGQPLELSGTERIDDVVIVMTYDTGGIDGTVAEQDGTLVSGASVLVFPDNSAMWAAGSPFVRVSRSGGSGARGSSAAVPGAAAPVSAARPAAAPGAFTAASLPAGRYGVVAFPSGTNVYQFDHQSIERWRESATIVTVTAGQTTAVKLTPIR